MEWVSFLGVASPGLCLHFSCPVLFPSSRSGPWIPWGYDRASSGFRLLVQLLSKVSWWVILTHSWQIGWCSMAVHDANSLYADWTFVKHPSTVTFTFTLHGQEQDRHACMPVVKRKGDDTKTEQNLFGPASWFGNRFRKN